MRRSFNSTMETPRTHRQRQRCWPPPRNDSKPPAMRRSFNSTMETPRTHRQRQRCWPPPRNDTRASISKRCAAPTPPASRSRQIMQPCQHRKTRPLLIAASLLRAIRRGLRAPRWDCDQRRRQPRTHACGRDVASRLGVQCALHRRSGRLFRCGTVQRQRGRRQPRKDCGWLATLTFTPPPPPPGGRPPFPAPEPRADASFYKKQKL